MGQNEGYRWVINVDMMAGYEVQKPSPGRGITWITPGGAQRNPGYRDAPLDQPRRRRAFDWGDIGTED